MPKLTYTVIPTKFRKNSVVIPKKAVSNIYEKVFGFDIKKDLRRYRKAVETKSFPNFYLKIGKDVILAVPRKDGRLEIPKNMVKKYKIQPSKPTKIQVYIPEPMEFSVGTPLPIIWGMVRRKGLVRTIKFNPEQSKDIYIQTKDGKFISQREILLEIVKDYIKETAGFYVRKKFIMVYTRMNFKIYKEKTGEILDMTFGQSNVEANVKKRFKILLENVENDFWKAFGKEEFEEYTEVWLDYLEITGYKFAEGDEVDEYFKQYYPEYYQD